MNRLAVLLILSVATLNAQVDTGRPSYTPSSGSSFDAINIGNLNINLRVPVLSKPGRGIPFTFTLVHDDSVWKKVQSGSSYSWQPALNWGWAGETQIKTGYIHYNQFIEQCETDTGALRNYTVTDYDYYFDSDGFAHEIGGQTWTAPGQCQSLASQLTFTIQATDGSGLTFTPTTVTTAGGTVFTPPVNTGSGTGLAKDSNGNKINVSSGSFTDTLGSTALSVTGTGTDISPRVYTYTDSSGTSRTVQVNYVAKTVKTYFQCPGVTGEYNQSTYLVSGIALPNGTSYSFQYEPSPDPSYPTAVTGRISRITLPTGGTIQYAYSGGDTNRGIDCSDGSNFYVDRTTTDGVTTYHREHVNLSQWKTTVIYANSDQTVFSLQSPRLPRLCGN